MNTQKESNRRVGEGFCLTQRFFVLDFDRCLGNTEKLQALLEEIAFERMGMARSVLQEARHQTEMTGGSFDTVAYLRARPQMSNSKWDELSTEFIKRAQQRTMLMPGARELLGLLSENAAEYGILTYGGEVWQRTKLAAAGLHEVPTLITDIKAKGRLMASWWSPDDMFHIPLELSGGRDIRIHRLILIDDKYESFAEFPLRAEGIHINYQKNTKSFDLQALPSNIITVSSLEQAKEKVERLLRDDAKTIDKA